MKAVTMTIQIGLLSLMATMFSPAAYAEALIVVNKNNPIEVLSRTEFTRVFLGRSGTFPDGSPVNPVNQLADAAVRAEVEEGILGKSASQIHAYWAKQMFSGQAKPPEELASDADVIAKVAGDPTAIGYISAGSESGEVKVIRVQ